MALAEETKRGYANQREGMRAPHQGIQQGFFPGGSGPRCQMAAQVRNVLRISSG